MNVILVDRKDLQIGVEEKLKAHLEGKLHRAFSVLVHNSKAELLIQQRAFSKYHSGGLWANTVCSHPRPNKDIYREVHRRLKEEMGLDCPIRKLFTFQYSFQFENGLIENEIDHVFVGDYEGDVNPNPDEVANYKWISFRDLKEDVIKNSRIYAYWFKKILENESWKSLMKI